jgi:hypothetical protein
MATRREGNATIPRGTYDLVIKSSLILKGVNCFIRMMWVRPPLKVVRRPPTVITNYQFKEAQGFSDIGCTETDVVER